MSEQVFVPAVRGPDGVLLVPTDSDFYEVTKDGAVDAGELLLDLMGAHQLTVAGIMQGTASEIQGRSTGTRIYDDVEFLELIK